MDTPEQPRAAYRPSGKVSWLRFLPGLAVTAGLAVVMAGCLFFAFQSGFYLILIAPLLATFPVAGVWYIVLTRSRCRNRAVAVGTSVVLALLLYLGYYYVGLVQIIGIANAGRIDLLPNYVRFRMKTDVARDAHHMGDRNRPQAPAGPDVVRQAFNWCFFGLELLTVTGTLIGAGAKASSKAFCEACGRWMKSETLVLLPGLGAPLWDSLQRGDFAEVESVGLTRTAAQNAAGCQVTIDYCPECPAENSSPAVYLTLKDLAGSGQGGATAPGEGPITRLIVPPALRSGGVDGLRTLVDRAALRPKEIGALAVALPGLRKTIEAQPNLFAEAQSAVRDIQREQRSPLTEWTKRVAAFEPVEPGDAGQVLTPKNAALQTLIGVVSQLGGLALVLGTGIWAALDPQPPVWVSGLLVIGAIGCLILNLIWVLCYPRFLTARFMLRQTRRAFEKRSGLAVDLNNPDLIFVDIIPRTNWGKAMLENASDIGFLQLDRERRELIFEGDRERYWIPVESILDVQHEFWSDSIQHQFQSEPNKYHVITVRAMTADGPRETWFYRRQDKFQRYTADQRLNEAMALQAKIRALMEPAS
jgi:hypothetical protein